MMSINMVRQLPLRDGVGNVRVVVETPAGSRVKYKYDETLGVFAWSRLLPPGLVYPFDYGFLPGTVSGDGDALDAIVWAEQPTQSGVVVPSRVIGALRVEQQRDGGPVKRNDRILVVPVLDPNEAAARDVTDVPGGVLTELERFFVASLNGTGKVIRLDGWADAMEAEGLVIACEGAFNAG